MSKNVAKTTVILMALTIMSKILGLIRESVMAASYGTSMYKAVYDIANNIPIVIFAIIGTALATSYIPVFNKIESKEGKDRSLEFTNSLINIVIIICIILSVLGIIFARPLVKVFAVGYSGEALDLAISFTRILLPTIITVGIANILTSFLQSKDSFNIPALIGLPYNFIIIASIIISKSSSIYVLVVGTFLAICSKMVFMIPESRRKGLRYKLKMDIHDKSLQEMVVLIMPVLVGVGAQQINSVVDKSLATTLGFNIVSSFGYAMRLYEFVQALLITSILSVIYPRLAKFTATDNMKAFGASLKKTLNVMLVALVPIVVGAGVLSRPIVRILFERSNFTANDTIITANIMSIYVIGLLAFSLRDVIARGFYSLHDSKTPMYNSVIAIVFNIILNLSLIKPLGYKGLAMATAISAWIGLFLFIRSIKKKIKGLSIGSVVEVFVKTSISASIMGILVYFVHGALISLMGKSTIVEIIVLAISVAGGALIYGVVLYLFKVEELYDILDIIKRALKSKIFNKLRKNN